MSRRKFIRALGYVTGWSMVMDYMLNPLICTIWCAQQAHAFAPGVPAWGWKIFFAVVFTLLNIRGVKTSARINTVMAIAMGAVVAVVFVAAARYIFGHPHDDPAFFLRPFYDPADVQLQALFGCTSIAVLTYIGFDGISTLSEEAENPRRNILAGYGLTCVVIGVLSAIEVYVAQLIWPASRAVSRCRYGVCLCGRPRMGAAVPDRRMDAAAGELWFGHGRAAWARRDCSTAWDAATHCRSRFLARSIRSIACHATTYFLSARSLLIGAFFLNYGLGAEMLNFGALIAFMGVNVAAFLRYFVRAEKKRSPTSSRRC